MICTFFGHHDCPDTLKPQLKKIVEQQIHNGVTVFFVGNHGRFDAMVLSCLRELKQEYPGITYTVVLAYLSANKDSYSMKETMLPEGIESVPKRFAIDFRNRYMLRYADIVITYMIHSQGGTAKYIKIALQKNKTVIYLDKPK